MKYLHTMVRVSDLDASLEFYCNLLGLTELRCKDVPLPLEEPRVSMDNSGEW